MFTRILMVSALALSAMAANASAASIKSYHEEQPQDGRCIVGTMDLGTTLCKVPGPAPSGHVMYLTNPAWSGGGSDNSMSGDSPASITSAPGVWSGGNG